MRKFDCSTSTRHLLLLILCVFPFIFSNSQSKKLYDLGIRDTLVLRGYKDFAPFECMNQNGEPEGFDVDLMKAVMEELGFKYRIELADLNTSIEETKKKRQGYYNRYIILYGKKFIPVIRTACILYNKNHYIA